MNVIRRILFSTSALLTILLIQKTDLRHTAQQTPNSSLSKSNSYQTLFRNIPAFGFRNILADHTFVQFLLYFGDDDARASTGYSACPIFFRRIIQHDPYFTDFYLFLSQSTSVYAGLPDRALEIMDRGVKKLAPNQPPDGYHIWRYKGVDELLFAGDSKSAQHSFETAAEWAFQSDKPDSETMGRMSQQTAHFLATDPDSKNAQISAWSSVLMAALEDETRERAIEEIRKLGGDVVFGEDGGIRIENQQASQKEADDSNI